MLDQPLSFFSNFDQYERYLSATMVTFSMLGMGATLTVRDFANTLSAWRGLAVGLVAQLVLVPIWAGLTLFAISLFPTGFGGLTAAGAIGIATGIALIAAMPGVCQADGADEVLLFIVDILNEEATLLVPNDFVRKVAEASFGATVEGDTVVLPGIMSRKKQIIPVLAA